MNIRLGIIEFRNIIKTIAQKHGIDFSDYALTSLKRRLENVIQVNNMRNADELIERLIDDTNFFDYFLKDILVPEIMMFRDPVFWKYLAVDIVPKLAKLPNAQIWLPDVSTGEELFSLLIILQELGLQNQIKVHATFLSHANLSDFREPEYEIKKMEDSDANYQRYSGLDQLSNFYVVKEGRVFMDKALLSNVSLSKAYLLGENQMLPQADFILYRNKMIYFNQQLQNKVVNVLHEQLNVSGMLAIGIKESLENSNADKKFAIVNKTENVFKRTQ